MSSRVRRAAVLPIVLLAAAMSSAVIAEGGGRVQLRSPIRMIDTRGGPGVTHIGLGSGVLHVTVAVRSEPGTATVHACSGAPGPDPTFRLDPAVPFQSARLTSAESLCMTSTVPVDVIVDVGGSVSQAPEAGRGQYIALPSPVTLHDEATTLDQFVVRLPRPAQLSVEGDAVLSVEVLTATSPGYILVSGCDSPPSPASDLGYGFNRVANIAFADLSPGEDICIFVSRPAHVRVKLLGELATSGPNASNLPPSWRYTAGEVPAPSLRPITPVRVLDTRLGLGRPGTAKVGPDEVVELDFGPRVGPLTTAVVLNVTAVLPDRAGHLTVWPCGGDRPLVSNLNFDSGEVVPNLVVSKLGPGGTVCLSGIAATHLLADLGGTYEADGGLHAVPVSPTRILDTRSGVGAPQAKLAAGQVLELRVVGGDVLDVPAEAGAVTVNVTATEAADAGHLTVYACGSERPDASNLNYVAGQSIANLVTATLSSTGSICIYALTDVHVIADIAAWYGLDQPAGLIELPPERVLDTRIPVGVSAVGKVTAGTFIVVDVAGRGGVAEDADAVVVNLTATQTDGFGYLTAWPCDASMPVVSNVNYGPGETNPNLATVKLAADGSMCIYSSASSHVVADVAGYLTTGTVAGSQLALQ